MAEWLRKLIENTVPWLVESRLPRRLLYAVFWMTTALLTFWFVTTGLVYGVLVMGAPLLLLLMTRLRGLGTVSRFLLWFAALMALVPAFFLGKYQASEDGPSGLVLVGYLVFLVWVAAFPTVLDKLDERFHLSLFPAHPKLTSLATEYRDETALYRVLVVKLWMATLAMLVVDNSIAAVICVFALLLRRRWTAVLAGLACLLETVFSVEGLELSWSFEPLEIVAGLLAADQWRTAWRNPLWDRRIRQEVW